MGDVVLVNACMEGERGQVSHPSKVAEPSLAPGSETNV